MKGAEKKNALQKKKGLKIIKEKTKKCKNSAKSPCKKKTKGEKRAPKKTPFRKKRTRKKRKKKEIFGGSLYKLILCTFLIPPPTDIFNLSIL